MQGRALRAAVSLAAHTADFEPLFDHLADDVELEVLVALQPPTREQWRGRDKVIRRLRRSDGRAAPRSAAPAITEPVEMLSDGNRIVACRSANVRIDGGVTIRAECTLVLDIRGATIRRLAIHHEFS